MKKRKTKKTCCWQQNTVFVFVIFSMLTLLFKISHIIFFDKHDYKTEARKRQITTVSIPAHRGNIVDRHGEPIAISTPVDTIGAVPKQAIESATDLSQLAQLLGKTEDKLKRDLKNKSHKKYIILKRQVNPTIAQKIKELKISGIHFKKEYKRYYLGGETASQLVGITDKDDEGQEGLEKLYNALLRGEPGKKRILKDNLRHTLKNISILKKPKEGQDIILSIDRQLQYQAYRDLKSQVIRHGALSGSIVVLDPYNGQILAMASVPAFNPNKRSDYFPAGMRNRAMTDLMEPGSVIKPFTVIAALASDRFNLSTTIDTSPGTFKVSNYVIKDIHDNGQTSVENVLIKSSNIGSAKIALDLEPNAINTILHKVGFGQNTQSGFLGEMSGTLKDSEKLSKHELATLSFGYNMQATLLQVARAYSVIATGGYLPTISFLKKNTKPARVLPATHTNAVLRVLEKVVSSEEGTGKKARIAGYTVAGKTGTIKKYSSSGGYSENKYISAFAGIAPASNPKLVCVVVIHEPSKGVYFGGEIAAPVFSKVMEVALRKFNISPDMFKHKDIHMDGSQVAWSRK